MGGGGLMQLVAYGSQDIYLSGKPQITFFKSVYRRHTNFAVESIQQDVLGTPQFGSQVSITISRNGDLLKKLWVEYSPIDLLEGINGTGPQTIGANIGHAIIESAVIEIGGQIVDKQYGKWLTIWNYLTETNPTGEQGAVDNYSTGPGEISPNIIFPTGDNSVTEMYPILSIFNVSLYITLEK